MDILHCYNTIDFIFQLKNELNNLANNVIFIGDINIILSQFDSNITVRKYENLLSNKSFISLINNPTRITNIYKTIINHIFVIHSCNDLFDYIFDLGLTDHFLLGLAMKSNFKQKMVKDVYNSNLCDKIIVDLKLVCDNLLEIDWSVCYHSNDVNVCYNKFEALYLSVINRSKVSSQYIKRNKPRAYSPWMNVSIYNRIKR